MSWSIFVQGKDKGNLLVPVAEARQQVLEAYCYEQKYGTAASPNEQQFEGVRGMILGELARLPEGQSVYINACGHADPVPGQSNISITMNTGPIPVSPQVEE